MMVGICDRTALFREALAAVVTSRGHEVVCCVSALADATRALERRRADVLLLDASLADGAALAQLRGRTERGRSLRVLLTASGGNGALAAGAAALEAGLVEGVLEHDAALTTLERAVKGQVGSLSRPRTAPAQARRAGSSLTAREYEVIGLLLAGRTTDAIASTLGVTPSTVHSHVQSILRKLGARNRIEAVNIHLGDTSRRPGAVPWS